MRGPLFRYEALRPYINPCWHLGVNVFWYHYFHMLQSADTRVLSFVGMERDVSTIEMYYDSRMAMFLSYALV